MKKAIFRLVGVILFVIILLKINVIEVVRLLLSEINIVHLIIAALFITLQISLKAYRWNYLKKKQGIDFEISAPVDKRTSNFVVFDPSEVKILEKNSKPVSRKELIEEQVNKLKD